MAPSSTSSPHSCTGSCTNRSSDYTPWTDHKSWYDAYCNAIKQTQCHQTYSILQFWYCSIYFRKTQKKVLHTDLKFPLSRKKYTKQELFGKYRQIVIQITSHEYIWSSLSREDNTLDITFSFLADAFSTKSCTIQSSDHVINKYTKHFYSIQNNNTTVYWCPHKKGIFILKKEEKWFNVFHGGKP